MPDEVTLKTLRVGKIFPRYGGVNLSLIALLLCCAIVAHAAPQGAGNSEPILVDGDSNEDSKAALALLAQTITDDEIVILIARLGKGEKARGLNRRRLQVVSAYLDVTRPNSIPARQVVVAEGDQIGGRGRVEVYLRGKLFMVFTLRRNRNFAPEP